MARGPVRYPSTVPSGCALRFADRLLVRPGLAEVDVEVFVGRRVRELVEVGQPGGDLLRAAGTLQPGAERLAVLAVRGVPAHDPHGRFRSRLGGQSQGLLAELRLLVADVAAEQHLVAGSR